MSLFNKLQQDMLIEAFNLGMGKAAASLSEIVQEEVLLSVPDISFTTKINAANELNKQTSGTLSGVSQRFSGPFCGEALLLFPVSKSLDLVRLLLQNTVPLENLTELEEEALNEIGNIIINAGLSSLADLFAQEIKTDLPTFRQGSCKEMLRVNDDTSSSDETVLLLRVDFKLEKNALEATVILTQGVVYLLDMQSFQDLAENIARYLASINI